MSVTPPRPDTPSPDTPGTAAASPLAGRERSLLAGCLLFMAIWVVLATAIALREPSLGWRFAPDPQGQGLLAYAPGKATKVYSREAAEQRFVAMRLAGSPAQTLQLESLVAVEAPSMLQRQDDLDRFFVLQQQAWQMLSAALASGQALELQTPDGQWQVRAVHARAWNELGWLFWVPLLCGVIPFVVGVGVGVYRWQSLGARYLALASVMALLALGEVSIVAGRLWLLAPWFAEAGQIFVRCTSLAAIWAFVMMVLHYPTPLRQARAWARGSGALLLVLVALNALQWPESQALRYKLWLVLGTAALLALSVWQGLGHRGDPVHRAAARWLGASTLLATSLSAYAFFVSFAFDAQSISTSYRWVSVPLLYAGLVFSVGRANLFELERWWLPVCLWYLGGTLVVLCDLALVALLQLNAGAALTLALLLTGWLYFPLRQWLLTRLQQRSRPRVITYVPDLIGAINAGLAGPQAARLAWRDVLQRVFDPQAIVPAPASALAGPTAAAGQARVRDLGRQLAVPDVDGQAWLLTLAQRGRHLFTQEHAETASQLWRLLEAGLAQQRQTQEAVDQERQRIASDLHDDLGAKLLTLVQVGTADGTAPLARQALEDMRQSVRGMAGKAVPAEDALADWRAELVSRLDAAGLAVHWEANDPPPGLVLLPRVHLQLTRILREAVSNVIRHSGARHCRITLSIDAESIALEVQDDGTGLPEAGTGRPGLGLANIERRARQLGGVHRTGRSAMGGALIQVNTPLNPA